MAKDVYKSEANTKGRLLVVDVSINCMAKDVYKSEANTKGRLLVVDVFINWPRMFINLRPILRED